MTELAVELYGHRVGTIVEAAGTFDFHADADAIDRHGLGSSILSFAVPLVPRARPGDAPLRRNFFDEILPEGRARTRLAGNAKLAPDYTVGMLARYGRDVAGAVVVWDPMAPDEPRVPTTRPLTPADVADLLREVIRAPVGNTSPRRMSSLAGVQDKIVLARTDDTWAEPLDGFPSTHIVKPVVPNRHTLIFDEEYGARIARHLGLLDYDTHLEAFGGVTALVIERYDRSPETDDSRIHQEDFNQILGMSGDGKYQGDGVGESHPGLAAIARVVRRAGRASLIRLLQMTTMSVAVGNLDMHAKNISMLHLPDGTSRLAPAYDIVPQLHQYEKHVVALKVNGKSLHADITLADLVAEGRGWGLRQAESVVVDTVASILEFAQEERQHPAAHFTLSEDITRLCRRLLDGHDGRVTPRATDSGTTTVVSTTASEWAPLAQAPGGWGGPVAR
ncbi:type II toxin-antitoxin system HipA family toxin [Frigoribacterium sp. PhB24]|uniref:type II toxin-antitoxin system HipA family toxin n=1 Tax=Frigoribacterium sp. PhB24 TaxID=2485204 RepID=UPI000F49BFCA|nr:HipA domain-containing protein [Frigoribacterium sp. PhB24]ROS49521.1 serine/threonine-protein kinase HipA [Frigoribacterium sp. PhB24]